MVSGYRYPQVSSGIYMYMYMSTTHDVYHTWCLPVRGARYSLTLLLVSHQLHGMVREITAVQLFPLRAQSGGCIHFFVVAGHYLVGPEACEDGSFVLNKQFILQNVYTKSLNKDDHLGTRILSDLEFAVL